MTSCYALTLSGPPLCKYVFWIAFYTTFEEISVESHTPEPYEGYRSWREAGARTRSTHQWRPSMTG